MEFDIPVFLNNDLEKKVADVFSQYDHIGNRTIDCRDIGDILRFLGCCPTEKNIEDIKEATRFKEAKGSVHLMKFVGYVCPMLIAMKMKPASPEQLLEAFQFLDPDGEGYIEKDYFIDLMLNEGEPLSESELKEMLAHALDPLTGEINYEYYINQLSHMPKYSIYDLAARVEEERRIAAIPPPKVVFELPKY